jgi:hypothetical protein
MSLSAAIPFMQLATSEKAFDQTPIKRSSLPVPNPTRSFWIDTPGANPLAAEGSDGPLVDDADICIIGSGITGVSAAYHLATDVERGHLPRPGDKPLRVVILEARDFCESFVFCLYYYKFTSATGSGATGLNFRSIHFRL